MLSLPNGTLLVLSPLSGLLTPTLTPYSTRGATQTLEPLTGSGGQGGGWIRRDVNGSLRSIADIRFRKYKSTISCRDGESAAIDDAWVGITVEVSCCAELSFPTGGTPARPVVSGSERVQGAYTYYRPQLLMMVVNIKDSFEEWAAINSWQIDLEEI